MKKAFALALAVLMVCTMAFAVSTGDQGGYTGGTSAADNTYMQSIVPGQSIIFTQEELGLTDQNWGKTNGNFDPKKNTVHPICRCFSNKLSESARHSCSDAHGKYAL